VPLSPPPAVPAPALQAPRKDRTRKSACLRPVLCSICLVSHSLFFFYGKSACSRPVLCSICPVSHSFFLMLRTPARGPCCAESARYLILYFLCFYDTLSLSLSLSLPLSLYLSLTHTHTHTGYRANKVRTLLFKNEELETGLKASKDHGKRLSRINDALEKQAFISYFCFSCVFVCVCVYVCVCLCVCVCERERDMICIV
jgi:hypothetical protein